MSHIRIISEEERKRQEDFALRVRDYYERLLSGRAPLAFVHTYGCQQNVSDSERLQGMLCRMGFGFVDTPEEADVILLNTCAVREHAQDRVFGNVGALKNLKKRKPHLMIALCGCMVQQPYVAERLKKSYPFVGLIFGTHVLYRFPELLWQALESRKQEITIPDEDGCIAEGLPVKRDGGVNAWIPIMYGCNHFCSYCVVPYVRGRERSRAPKDILREVEEVVGAGTKEITLLGQNVNAYGKGEANGVDFPRLLRMINEIPGNFIIRFMTSHPKDATHDLFLAMAECDKVSGHLHLPVQSGSTRVLRAMNRGYTREQYLSLVEDARRTVPEIALTSDIIVGFPGETREDFEQTLSLVDQVEFVSLFTFIFSPRRGTPAADMPDPVPYAVKSQWLQELCARQESISARRTAAMVGKTLPALIESDAGAFLEARLEDNSIVRVPGDSSMVGNKAMVEITSAKSWVLSGEIRKWI